MNLVKKIWNTYNYLLYRIYIWQKRINGKDSAPEIAACSLPGVMILGSFFIPFLCLIDYIGIEIGIIPYFIAIIFALFLMFYSKSNINMLEKKYENETIFERKQRTKEMWILIGGTFIWIIIFVLLITEPSVDSETIDRLKELRNS